MFLISKISLDLILIFACGEIKAFSWNSEGSTSVKPSPDDIRDAYNVTSWIKNGTAREMLVQYLALCPGQDMCLGDELKREYVFDASMTRSCTVCDCDDSCVRKSSCCPSKFLQIANGSTDDNNETKLGNISTNQIPLVCLMPFWNIHSYFRGPSYWMIDSCPNGETCIPQETQWRNMSLFTPVTSLSTNETYRYLQCALCNRENEKDLQIWNQDQFVCNLRSDLLSANLSEVFNKEQCNVLFYPPETVQELVISCQTFDHVSCNMSGTLKHNETFLIDACNAYIIPYTTDYITYKNIYCALCNDIARLTQMPIEYTNDVGYGPSDAFPVFSALIDFKEKTPADETLEERMCAFGKIYNAKLNVCLDLFCEVEYGIMHNSDEGPFCKPLHPQWGENNYEINLIFKPTEEVKDNTILQDMRFSLDTYLEDRMTLNNLSDYICSLYFFDLENGKSRQLGVLIELTVTFAHDLNDMIKQLLNTFTNDDNILLTDSVFGKSINVSSSIIGQRFHLYEKNRMTFCQYIDPITYTTLTTIYEKVFTNNRRYCLKSPSTIVVADWYRCPKVKMTTKDTIIRLNNFSVCLPELNLCVPSRYFKKSPNNQEVDICYSWYTRASEAAAQSSLYDEVDVYLSLICLSLSTGGSILTVISYCARPGSLSSAGSNIVILSIFLISANTVYSVSKVLVWSKLLCLIAGVVVHFLWLSVIFWMSLSSFMIFHTFTNFTNVTLKQNSNVLRFLLINCLLCVLFIVINVMVSYYSTGGESFGYSTSTCYIADPSMILYTFVLPVAVAVCLNTFMFIVTVSRIYQKEDVRKSKDKKRVSAYFRLSTLTGISWCFGFLAQITNLEVFSILHTVFGAGQGVFLYLAFGLPLGLKCKAENIKSEFSSTSQLK